MRMELWTEKYRPRSLAEMAGQQKTISTATAWLEQWRPGRALFLHGRPGAGKTMLAELLAQERQWELMQLNASDQRRPEEIAKVIEAMKTRSLWGRGKLILLDEVDGLGQQDRGAVAAIIELIRTSRYPVILTANDPWDRKLVPLRGHCDLVRVPAVPSPSIAKRLREICMKEGIEADDSALKALARWAQGDMRSAVSDLQTAAAGNARLEEKDLEILGYRERGTDIFSVLPILFNARNIMVAKQAVQHLDKDPDELFWWVESNMEKVFRSPEELARGYELLAIADVARGRVVKQQNWRFRLYMTDLLAGISLMKEQPSGFVPFQPPQRLVQMARAKKKRGEQDEVFRKIGAYVHCSRRAVRREYLPYLPMLLQKKTGAEGLELAPEEIKIIRNA